MRIETPVDRQQHRLQNAIAVAAAQERERAAKKAAQEKENGFLEMCEINHREALERDAMMAKKLAARLDGNNQEPENASIGGLEESTVHFCSGFGAGALFMAIVGMIFLVLYFAC